MQVLTRSQFQLDLRTITAAQVARIDLDAIMSLRRFSAQTGRFWSVAQHSMNVARVVKDLKGDANAQAWAILHDAHEAYIGDLIRPLLQFLDDASKASIQNLCRTIDTAVAERFRLTLDPHTIELVAKADDIVLAAEILELFAIPADRMLEIDVVKRHWPLIQYVKLEVMEPKMWGKAVDALWQPANTVGAA
jgi:hypothetical protein